MNERIDQLTSYLKDKPEDRFAMYSLALEYKKLGEVELARAAFVELLRVHPDSGAGHYQHGLLFAEIDDVEAARTAWEAGLAQLAGVRSADARRSIAEIQGALAEFDD